MVGDLTGREVNRGQRGFRRARGRGKGGSEVEGKEQRMSDEITERERLLLVEKIVGRLCKWCATEKHSLFLQAQQNWIMVELDNG